MPRITVRDPAAIRAAVLRAEADALADLIELLTRKALQAMEGDA